MVASDQLCKLQGGVPVELRGAEQVPCTALLPWRSQSIHTQRRASPPRWCRRRPEAKLHRPSHHPAEPHLSAPLALEAPLAQPPQYHPDVLPKQQREMLSHQQMAGNMREVTLRDCLAFQSVPGSGVTELAHGH